MSLQPTQRITHNEVWRAASAQAAKEYLNTRVITQRLYYLVVETPEGNWGKDVDGAYKE
ncbi:MAG: hypothetical protein ACLQPD_18965 [Desulfomonilaceae bacterium]